MTSGSSSTFSVHMQAWEEVWVVISSRKIHHDITRASSAPSGAQCTQQCVSTTVPGCLLCERANRQLGCVVKI